MTKTFQTLASKHQAIKATIVASLVVIFTTLAMADDVPAADWAKQVAQRWMNGDQTDGRDKVVAAGYALHESALADDAEAQFVLAQLYEAGLPRYGGGKATRHPAQAMGWYMRAARLGHEGALARLKELVDPAFEAPKTPTGPVDMPAEETKNALD